jgi:molybdate transport system ATP-binding protein
MTLSVDITIRRGTFAVRASFDAGRGSTTALLGPNGSGKSTLVSSMAGLVPPEQGSVVLEGTVLDEPAARVCIPPERRPIGVVFQDLLLFPHLSALENVEFPLLARGVARGEAHDRSQHLLRRLEVVERAGAKPRDLSGGEAQRVALARALVAEPALLLLDEPLSALDVGARARLRQVVRDELERFPGIRILVTHDPVEAFTMADRLVIVEDGRVTQIGTPEEIRSAPRSRYASELVGANAIRGVLEPIGEGTGRLLSSEGELVVPWPEWYVEGEVVAIVRPIDVTLWPDRPEGSARNVLPGRVTSVAIHGDRARVRLATAPPLVAEVTLGSVERLRLRSGVEVWASFKAVEVELLPP